MPSYQISFKFYSSSDSLKCSFWGCLNVGQCQVFFLMCKRKVEKEEMMPKSEIGKLRGAHAIDSRRTRKCHTAHRKIIANCSCSHGITLCTMGSQPVLFSLLPGLAGVWHIHTYRRFCWHKLTLSAWRIYCEQAWLTRGHAETPPPGFIITPASRCRKIDFQFFDGARLRTLLNAFMQCNTQQVIPFGMTENVWSHRVGWCDQWT